MGWLWNTSLNTSLACGTCLLACAFLLSLSPLCTVELVGVGSSAAICKIGQGGRQGGL